MNNEGYFFGNDNSNNNNNIIEKNKFSNEKIFRDLETIEFLSDSLLEITNEEYQSVLTGNVSEANKKEIFHKIISNIILDDSYSKEQAREIYRYLLNRDGSYDDAEVEFISYYTIYLNYYRTKYDENGRVKPGYEDVRMPKLVFISPDEDEEFQSLNILAAYQAGLNVVYVNRDSSALSFRDGGKEELFSYLQCLSHEMVHHRQAFEANNGILNPSSFNYIVSSIIRIQSFDAAESNYRFRREEVEAQIESMRYVVELGKEFLPEYTDFQIKMTASREDYMLEEALSMQHDDMDTLVLRDFYDIGGLSVAVANNPLLLKKFPQLLSFFDRSGDMRSEEELLRGYQSAVSLGNSVADIYEEFLVYMYHKEPVIKNTNLSPQLLAVKKDLISMQVRKELVKLTKIKRIVDDHKKKIGSSAVWEKFHTEGIVEMRKKRLELYYNFLSDVGIIQAGDEELLNELSMMVDTYDNIIIDLEKNIMINDLLDEDINNKLDSFIDNNSKITK